MGNLVAIGIGNLFLCLSVIVPCQFLSKFYWIQVLFESLCLNVVNYQQVSKKDRDLCSRYILNKTCIFQCFQRIFNPTPVWGGAFSVKTTPEPKTLGLGVVLPLFLKYHSCTIQLL